MSISRNREKNIGDKIKILRLKVGVLQADLADFAGCNKSTISNAERGANKILATTLFKIAKYFNVPVEIFDEDYSESKFSQLVSDNPSDIRHFPLLGFVSENGWYHKESNNNYGWVPVDINSTGKNSFGLIVEGDSMYDKSNPIESYQDKTRIIIDPDLNDPRDGALVLAFNCKTDEGIFRKLLIDNRKKMLMPINNIYQGVDITNDKDIVIVGEITWSYYLIKRK